MAAPREDLLSPSAQATLGVAVTDGNGDYDITNQYTCPSANTPVYLTATGGNPGLGGSANNSALVLMAALGTCGSLTSTEFVDINEVTTVASVYAFAQYFGSGTPNSLGTASTGSGGAQTGILNSSNTVVNMITLATGAARTTTVNGIGYVPQTQINMLADILVPCVNSSGPTSTACAALFAAATPSGGTAPTTTLGAALDIALNPGNNVTTLFNLSTANTAFVPALSAATNDWTIAVAYDLASANHPQGLAIDGSGNAWITAWVSNNPANAEVVMISPIGVPAPNNPYTTNLAGSERDLPGRPERWNVWIANSTSNSAVALDLSGGSIALRYGPYPAAAELSTPLQVAVDGTVQGNVWFTNSGNNTLTEIIPSPTFATATYNFYSGGGLSTPAGIAYYEPFAANSVWVANSTSSSVSEFTPTSGGTTTGNNYTGGGVTNPSYVAVDGAGNAWFTDTSSNQVAEFNTSGGVVSPTGGWTGGGLNGPSGIAVDGANNIWVANTGNSSLTELNGSSGAPLSPSTGYQTASLQAPTAIAIDAGGNVWAINSNETTSLNGLETVTEFLGLAAPVDMPLASSVASHEIGHRPQ